MAPVFLFVLLFLVVMVRLAAVQMALHDTASQAVRQTAAHIYPIALAAEQSGFELPTASIGELSLSDIESVAGQLAEWIPEPAGPLLESIGEGDWSPVVDMAATEIGRGVVQPLLRQFAEASVLDPDEVRLYRLSMPDLKEKQEPYFSITVEYELPLNLPFTRKTLTLRERAEERVWVSDAIAAPITPESSEDAADHLQILAIEPSPVRPGRKARVIALTDPNRKVSLTVEYKSGTSKAKFLGEQTADADGMVSWEWHVSGNTTPGVWELYVSTEDSKQVGMHFSVEKAK
ncbi:hypothetical protein GCM10010916_22410 [Paenibacillus abyssi]|uniref:Uncharacterized protein n=1 Tax=Paenibacillus abyssi TaxID=1340531 RepID=A0A917FVE4_9BACL|nr:hypothetical protein GCM10010916_22410 [Paenibacillus abyssi]